MLYYRFHQANSRLVVITSDVSGANLPKAEGAWRADGQTHIDAGGRPRFGIDPKEIIAAIERDGFFLASLTAH